MTNDISKPLISKRIFTYIVILLLFLTAGFFISSYIISKSFHYAEVVNISGKIRGNIQRFVKLYFAGDKEKLPKVANEIDSSLKLLEKKVENLKLPLIDDDKNMHPIEVINCWSSLSEAILQQKKQVSNSTIFQISELCWFATDKQTLFYQKIAQRNLIILNIIYYFIFILTIIEIILLLKFNFSEIFRKLEIRANFDPLTRVLNRGALKDIFENISKDKFFYPMALIILDVDNFKYINDTYGHNIGDIVLKRVALEIKKHLRRSDILARWGGEEFVVILPHTDLEGARIVAEKLRKSLEEAKILEGEKITASFGVTEILPKEPLEKAVLRADKALYRAKELGKNRVEVNPPEGE